MFVQEAFAFAGLVASWVEFFPSQTAGPPASTTACSWEPLAEGGAGELRGGPRMDTG